MPLFCRKDFVEEIGVIPHTLDGNVLDQVTQFFSVVLSNLRLTCKDAFVSFF